MNRALIPAAALLSTALPFLIDSALKGTALIILAAVGALMLPRASAATRHLVWLFAVGALVILPILSAFLPAWRILPRLNSMIEPAAPSISLNKPVLPVTDQQILSASEPQAISIAVPVSPTAAPIQSLRLRDWLPLVWAGGVALLLARLFAAQWLLARVRNRCRVVDDDRLSDAARDLRRHLGIRQPVQLLLDSRRTIPMVWGVFRPRLLLPAEAVDWDETRLRSVLLHELAHVKRRDAMVQWLMQLACALHWFNPFVWFAAWRMHVESERACDDLVVTNGVRASDYAGHLLHVATNLTSAKGVHACGLAMARQSRLEGRLMAVLNERLNRRRVTRTLALSALLLVLCVVIPVAMLRAAPDKVAEAVNTTTTKTPIADQTQVAATQPDASARTQPRKPAEFSSLPEKPWTARGRVNDASGKPLEDVDIWVYAGMGTLRRTGITKTDNEGRYEVSFGRGIWMSVDSPNLQFASVTAHKPGFAEVNLSRQGARAAALREVPAEELKSYSATPEQMFLPDKPQTIDFVMTPAARIKGRLVGTGTFPRARPQFYHTKEGQTLPAGYSVLQQSPLAGWSVWLVGKQLPPASSVLASAETDENGEFVFENVPTGFEWQFQSDTQLKQAEPKSAPFKLEQPVETTFDLELPENQQELRLLKSRPGPSAANDHPATAHDVTTEAARANLNLLESELKRATELRQQNLISEADFNETRMKTEIARAELAGRTDEVKRIKLQQAEAELKRLTDLQKKNLVSKSEVELAKSNYNLLRADLNGDAVEAARVRLQQAESDLARTADLREKNLVSKAELERTQSEAMLLRAQLNALETKKSAAQKPLPDETRELIKARDEARTKAEMTRVKLLENGSSVGSLGFDEARVEKERELAEARNFSERLAAYQRYAKKTQLLEQQIQKEVEAGSRSLATADIAHYEKLQAEVELAQAKATAPGADSAHAGQIVVEAKLIEADSRTTIPEDIEKLARTKGIKILSAPRMNTLDGGQAEIFIGSEVPASVNPAITNWVRSGITVRVTPHVQGKQIAYTVRLTLCDLLHSEAKGTQNVSETSSRDLHISGMTNDGDGTWFHFTERHNGKKLALWLKFKRLNG